MNRKYHVVFRLLIGILIFSGFRLIAGELTFVTADHPALQYTGRIDFSDPAAPRLFWPGTSIRAVFTGSSLQVVMDDAQGQSYYNVIIDDDQDPVIIACQPGLQIYPVASGLKDTIHSVLIFRRTEASTGKTVFKGFLIDADRSVKQSVVQPERRIEFYGNSITVGMGNEADPDSGDDKFSQENNYLTYAAITARNLNAEYVCIAKSGIGIMVSWFDLIMPNYYYRLDPDDPESQWDFARYTPDVVVINLLQNDSWLYDKRLDPVPDTRTILEAYKDFVSRIRIKYPQSQIVCTLGIMDAIAPGKPWPEYVRQAVRELQNNGDHRISAFIFSFDGFTKHPRVSHHKKMADELTGYIRQLMNW